MCEDLGDLRYAAAFQAEPTRIAGIRGEVAAVAAQHGISGRDLIDLRIAVSEIVTNAVVHAYAGTTGEIRVAVYARGRHLRVVIADDGPGMAPRVGSPGLGLGLPAAANAASDLSIVEPDGGGTEVHLTFSRPPCSEPCGARSD